MSSAASVSDATKVTEPAPRPWRPLLGRGLWLVTLLLIGLTAWRETPREVSRWYLAAAQEHHADAAYARLQGKGSLADQKQKSRDAALARALSWNPKNVLAMLQRAQWRVDREPDQALADCDLALKAGGDEVLVHRVRSQLLASMGRMRQATDELLEARQQMSARHYPASALAAQLNEVAYMRAVSKSDLHQALKEINEALKSLPKPDQKRLTEEQAQSLVAYLDTRGYILLLLNRPKEAINDMDSAEKLIRERLQPLRFAHQLAARDLRDFHFLDRERHYSYGVIYYHRSLVLEKLGHKKDALRDRNIAKSYLGREPDESVF